MKMPLLVLVVIATAITLSGFALAAAPEIGPIEITGPIHLSAGTITKVTCNATVNDSDGFDNISGVSAVLYDNYTADAGSADDNNYHYSNSSCSITGSGNTSNASCSFLLWYYANPSDSWICNMNVSDSLNTTSAQESTALDSLVAISVHDFAYTGGSGGPIPLGNISKEAALNITNTGNVNITIDLSGGDISCDTGIIPAGNQSYSITSGFNYSNGTMLTGSPTEIGDYTIPARTDDSAPSKGSIYWLLAVPGHGVSGNCTGAISVDAYELK